MAPASTSARRILDVAVDFPGVGYQGRDPNVVQAAGRRSVFDEDVELEVGRERLVEVPSDQSSLADRDAPHESL